MVEYTQSIMVWKFVESYRRMAGSRWIKWYILQLAIDSRRKMVYEDEEKG